MKKTLKIIWISLFLLPTVLVAQQPASPPKKVIINGGAAPTKTSDLLNDDNFVDQQYVDSVASAVRGDITSYNWIVAGENSAQNTVSNGEAITIQGGTGIDANLSGNTLSIVFDWSNAELTDESNPSNSDFLMIWNSSEGTHKTQIGDLPFATSINFNVATDETSTFITIGNNGLLDINGGNGIVTEVNAADVVINLNPDEYNLRSASAGDFVLTWTGQSIGKTQIGALPVSATSSYNWTVRADDGNTNNVSDNEILDIMGGFGAVTRISGGDLSISLSLHNLNITTAPAQSRYIAIFSDDGSVYQRTTIENLLSGVGGGSGDITNVSAGNGLSGGGTSGSVTLNLDPRAINRSTSIGRGTDIIPTWNNTYNELAQIEFHDLLGDVLVAGPNITMTKALDERTITIEAESGGGGITSIASGNFTEVSFTGSQYTVGLDEAELLDFVFTEDEHTSSGSAFFNTIFTDHGAVSSNADRRVAHLTVNYNSASKVVYLPDPDSSPAGSRIVVLVEDGFQVDNGHIVQFQVFGQSNEFYRCTQTPGCSRISASSAYEGIHVLYRMHDPESSDYVWSHQLPYN